MEVTSNTPTAFTATKVLIGFNYVVNCYSNL